MVPWSNAEGISSIELQKTVQTALREETGLPEAGPSSLAQWARLAVPLTVGEQGEVVPRGLPAVLLSASG